MNREAYTELSLRELRVLYALLQQRSITRTAQAMETTQPSISKMLRRLRAHFSDPLFVRNGQAMQPTAKALDIADRLRALLAAADGLRLSASEFDPASSDRRFSLLLTDVGMIRFLPPLIARLAAIAPNIGVRAVPLDARQFEHRLETAEADLAFGAFPKAARHLRRQRLYFDGYSSVVRELHPRARKCQAGAGFLAERHILVTGSETGHAAHRTAHRVLSSAIAPANVMLRVPSFIAGAIVAAETDGVATLPTNLAKRLAGPLGLIAFEPPIALPRIEIAQFWHERYHRDPGHKWLRGLTFELFSGTAR
ncbi:MAG TPA: LysR family transcriptional regulator [Bradyrhizobium sp.]|nr:LysR family transcriptional regulator [Bradyrhizobium sp.]